MLGKRLSSHHENENYTVHWERLASAYKSYIALCIKEMLWVKSTCCKDLRYRVKQMRSNRHINNEFVERLKLFQHCPCHKVRHTSHSENKI